MRIDGFGIQQLNGVQPVQRQNSASDVASVRHTVTDNVDLSSRVREMQHAQQAIAGLPEVREALVAELKAKIAAGLYNPSAEDIARKMLGE